MNTTGRHLLIEYWGCRREVLDDIEAIESAMRRAAEAADARIVASVFHPFTPHGVTGVVIVEESHLSIHTWPERGYAAVDIFTCGACRPERAHALMKRVFQAAHSEVLCVRRGARGGMRVRSLDEEGDSRGGIVEEAAAEDPFKQSHTAGLFGAILGQRDRFLPS